MIISFRCPPRIKKRIDDLIDSGLYPDISSFCLAAVENQLLLEETHGDSTEMPAREDTRSLAHWSKKPESTDPNPGKSARTDPTGTGQPSQRKNKLRLPVLPVVQLTADEPPFPLPINGADLFRKDDMVPVDRWLFGQYNRLLPAKFSIRALTNIARQGKKALVLEEVGPRIADAAAQFGSFLRLLDGNFDRHRDNSYATAFPAEGLSGEKGRARYQNHFVGHTVKGEQGGLLAGLKLAVIHVKSNRPHIFPTKEGWDFSQLQNPLLDQVPDSDSPSFTEEEVKFLLEHIEKNVPIELFAYRVLLSLLLEGIQKPESVTEALFKYLSPDRDPKKAYDLISTQRTGVLGRMTDLDLVRREREGTRISYILTERGKIFAGNPARKSGLK